MTCRRSTPLLMDCCWPLFLGFCSCICVRIPLVKNPRVEDPSIDSFTRPMSPLRVLPMREMKKPRPAGELLSLADVCERLDIHPLHVYALAYYGHLRTV